MSDINLKRLALNGLFWKLLENFGAQFINFCLQLILARILMPETYGIVALTSIFITVSNVFIQTGFSSGLIQKKETSDREYSSVFYFGIMMSFIIYSIIFLVAPLFAKIYSEPSLILILRVQAITIILAGSYSVHNTILVKELDFKKNFKIRILAIVFQGIVGISLATLGLEAMALVFSNLVNSVVVTISLWIFVKWRPKLEFSLKELKNLYSFSSRVLLVNLINTIFNNLKSLIIGKKFEVTTLGYYNRGFQIPSLLMVNTEGAISTVAFPLFSKYQDDKEKFCSVYRRIIKTSTFIVFPVMMGLIVVAEPLTIILLTEKWLPSVPFLQITALICMTWPFSIAYHAFNGLGRSELSLKLNIIVKSIELFLMIFSIQYGVYAFVMSTLISSIISVIIGSVMIQKIIGYKMFQQLKDILKSFAISLLMTICVYYIGEVIELTGIKLIVQILVGIIVYFGLCKVLKEDSLKYFLSLIKESKSMDHSKLI